MSPSDRRTATRGDRAPTADPPAGRGTGAPEPSFELPEIVPATADDEPGPLVERDATENWTDAGAPPVVVAEPTGATAPLRARGRRPRVRRVTRTVRHVDPWSTFKIALVFSAVLYVVVLTSGVLLWNVALRTGTVDNVERWFTQFGWETFEMNGGEIYHNAWIAGLFGAVGLTGLAVLAATLFNLVSDMVGGVRVTVLEEEVVERTTSASRRYVVRRPPTDAAAEPASADRPSAPAVVDPDADATAGPGAWGTAPPGGAPAAPGGGAVRTARRVDPRAG